MSAFVQPAKNQEEREDSNKSHGLEGRAIKDRTGQDKFVQYNAHSYYFKLKV